VQPRSIPIVHGWKQALGALALAYPERLAPHLG
jgi:hypothetical protein